MTTQALGRLGSGFNFSGLDNPASQTLVGSMFTQIELLI
jgi:hypothetical protein